MITDKKLIEQYKQLHSSGKYGQTARSARGSLQVCMDEIGPRSIIEYGCGQSQLYKILKQPGIIYDRYDPAIEGLSEIPNTQYDLLINTDVLEHIPEHDLDSVLKHFKSLTDHAYIRISTRLARTILPDGTNAHCTVWPGERWLDFIKNYFPDSVMPYQHIGETCLILTWKSKATDQIAHLETEWANRKNKPVKKFLKKLEISIRKARNALIGKTD